MKTQNIEPKDMTPGDVKVRVEEILNDNIMKYNTDNICLLDLLVEIHDTEDITVVNSLKNRIISMFEETVLYRIQFCKPIDK